MNKALLMLSALCAALAAGLILWSLCTPITPWNGLFIDRGTLGVMWEGREIARPGEALSYEWSCLGISYQANRQSEYAVSEEPQFRTLMVPLYWLLLLFSTTPAVWVLTSCCRTRRELAGKCPKCGCDLRADSTRCPECGYTKESAPA